MKNTLQKAIMLSMILIGTQTTHVFPLSDEEYGVLIGAISARYAMGMTDKDEYPLDCDYYIDEYLDEGADAEYAYNAITNFLADILFAGDRYNKRYRYMKALMESDEVRNIVSTLYAFDDPDYWEKVRELGDRFPGEFRGYFPREKEEYNKRMWRKRQDEEFDRKWGIHEE